MSASDLFSWLPDWSKPVSINYRFSTVINQSEPGAEQSRIPLHHTMKRTISCTHFSPRYLSNIENFLRSMHADFYQVPIFTEPIKPTGTFGAPLKGVTSVSTVAGLLDYFNLNNLCSHVIMIDVKNENNSELHTIESVSDSQIVIGGAFSGDFYIGTTVYYPCMLAYTNEMSDNVITTAITDSSLVFEEYF